MELERLLKEVKQSLPVLFGSPHAEALSIVASLKQLWVRHLDAGGKNIFKTETRENLQEQGLPVKDMPRQKKFIWPSHPP